jgi:hypothetical protein
VTAAPLWVETAFQAWATCWPDGNVQPTRHPLSGSPRLVSATEPVKPPGHWDGTESSGKRIPGTAGSGKL